MRKYIAILLCVCLWSSVSASAAVTDTPIRFVYKLHGQTRKFTYTFIPTDHDGLTLEWGIERNLHWQSGRFVMSGHAVEHGTVMSFRQPVDGETVELSKSETYAMVSREALKQLRHDGRMKYNNTEYALLSPPDSCVLRVVDVAEGCRMSVLNDSQWPLVLAVENNPLGINWKAELNSAGATAAVSVRDELRLNPDKSGSIYYAYPGPADSFTPAPAGYVPFYISHYGRHGSRWISTDERYSRVVDQFELHKSNLTPLGQDVRRRLQLVWDDARGHGGELTPLGNRQHHDLAVRMTTAYPEVFSGEAQVWAKSSTVGRCIMSMAAFCDGLKETNPRLRITREASKRDMAFIAYDTPEAEAHGKDDAYWRADFFAFEDSVQRPDRFMASLFTDTAAVTVDKRKLMEDLYWIAVDMQNVELGDLSFYDLFTADELFNIWQTINYRMYVRNGMSPEGRFTGPRSAESLLQRIVADADSAMAAGVPAAHLRFGHDTYLIRLLGLMGVPGCDARETERNRYYEAWQDYRISPMAANLQMIFYRDASGEVSVKVLHNEHEVRLPVDGANGPYYKWADLRRYFQGRIASIK